MAVLGTQLIGELAGCAFARGMPGRRHVGPAGAITTLVSARLDNEAPVLLDTIASFVAAGSDVTLASNGRHEDLQRRLVGAPSVTWMHDADATTKAENINRAVATGLRGSGYVLLADADTRPFGPLPAVPADATPIVQYPRLVRLDRGTALERVIAMEFAVKCLQTYPRRWTLSRTAYLGGSGAIVSTAAFERHPLDAGALVEDIDVSLRCALDGGAIAFSVDAIFTDLAPSSARVWLAQRRRWATGWLQLCSRYARPVLTGQLPRRARASWAGLLLWRRLAVPAAVVAMAAGVASGHVGLAPLVRLGALVELVGLARMGSLIARHRAVVAGALGEPVGKAVISYLLACVPYTVALWLVDIAVLIHPARTWQVTTRIPVLVGGHAT